MNLATYIGISITEFWELTPFEISIAANSYKKRKAEDIKEYDIKFKNQIDLAMYQAFLISRWVWQKKVDIKKILQTKEEKKKMTDDEMLAQVKALNVIFGGEVKTNG